MSSSASRFAIPACALLVCLPLVASCGAETGGDDGEDHAQTITDDLTATTVTGYPIKVYFSKNAESLTNFNAVYPVKRVSTTSGVGTFALQLLIAGPTHYEFENGYFSELNGILTGPSDCSAPLPVGGPDFRLTLNKKGSVTETGTATVRFCRTTQSPGVGADARIKAEIGATLKQFSTIQKVVILTQDGHCFGDQSGADLCLQ